MMREMKDIKKYQLEIRELKDTLFKMKSSLVGLKSRGTKDTAAETIQIEAQREKGNEKKGNRESIATGQYQLIQHIYVIRIPGKGRRA